MNTEAQKKELGALFQNLREAYGRQPLSEAALAMQIEWWDPYSPERLRRAIAKLGPSLRHPPSVAELLAQVNHLAPSQEAAAVDSWLMRNYENRSLKWSQAQLDEAIKALGLSEGCVAEGEI